MFTEQNLIRWLSMTYPELSYQTLANGAYGVYQEQYTWIEYDFRGFEFFNLDIGYSPVFVTRNRMLGGWIKDEIQSRDPKLSHNEGNVFYQGRKLSLDASKDKARRDEFAKVSGEIGWETIKRNPALMERIGKKLKKGDHEGAAKEVTLDEIAKNAYLENPSEMKDKSFHKSVSKLER